MESLKGRVVLVVHADADRSRELAAELRRNGAHVREVTGAANVAHVLQGLPILVEALVCDLGLPGAGAYDLVKTLRTMAADRGASIRAVGLTASDEAAEHDRARAAGFARCMSNATPSEVVAALESAFRGERP